MFKVVLEAIYSSLRTAASRICETMTDNQTTDNQRESGYLESGKQTAQRKLLKDAMDVLRDNREALSHLPELLEQLIDMPEATASAEKTANAVDESR